MQLSELYRQGAVQREVPDVVDVVLGPDAVRQRLGQVQAAAERRVDAFVLREVALIDGSENTEEDRALARGVQYRVVVEASVLERQGFLDQARAVMPLGEEIRVLPTLPTRLFIADGELALLPMHSHGDEKVSGALLVHPSGLLDLVNAMFEESWRAATRLVEGGELEADDEAAVDRALLKLLLLGHDGCRGGRAARHLGAHRAATGLRAHGGRGRDHPDPARRGGRAPRLGLIGATDRRITQRFVVLGRNRLTGL